MNYLAVCMLCVLGVELFIRLPFARHISALGSVSRKSARVVSSSKISDHWKEKALQRYSKDMAVASLLTGFYLLLLGAIASVFAMAIDWLLNITPATLEYLVTAPGLIIATVFSVLYVVGRKRLVST